MKRPSLTVGIPTCYGGETLLATVKTIVASRGVGPFRFVVVADTTPISAPIRQELKKLGVELIWNTKPGSQARKIRQLLALTKTDIFVFTQDDVRFESDTLARVMDVFSGEPDVTMVTTRVLPEPAETLFERILEVGTRVAYNTARTWKRGENYLMANGRCMGFRMSLAKRFVIHDESVNNDAYLYLENKRLGGICRHQPEAIIYNKSPLFFREHLNQTSRFQYSRKEMANYFGNVDAEYDVPAVILLTQISREFFRDPFYTCAYLAVNAYAKLAKRRLQVRNPAWSADVSTKRVKSV